jgi:hypothetical protein
MWKQPACGAVHVVAAGPDQTEILKPNKGELLAKVGQSTAMDAVLSIALSRGRTINPLLQRPCTAFR